MVGSILVQRERNKSQQKVVCVCVFYSTYSSEPQITNTGEQLLMDDIERPFQLGILAFRQKRQQEALAHFNEVISLDPENIDAYLQKGSVEIYLKKYIEALVTFHKAKELNPNRYQVYIGLANCKAELRQQDEALSYYDSAISLSPHRAQAHHLKGILLKDLKQYKKALKCFQTASAIHPTDVDIQQDKAELYYQLQKYSEALESYNKLLQIKENARLHLSKAKTLSKMSRAKEAVDSLQSALRLNHTSARLYRSCASVYLEIGDNKKALQYATESFSYDPNSAEGFLLRGQANFCLGNLKQALSDAQQCLAMDNSNFMALILIGAINQDEGRFEEALEWYGKAASVNPRSPLPCARNAALYLRVNNLDDAESSINKSFQLLKNGQSSQLMDNISKSVIIDFRLILKRCHNITQNEARQKILSKLQSIMEDIFSRARYRHIDKKFEAQASTQMLEIKNKLESFQVASLMEDQKATRLSVATTASESFTTNVAPNFAILQQVLHKVIEPLTACMYPAAQVHSTLRKLQAEQPNVYLYVMRLHQCLNATLQTMLILETHNLKEKADICTKVLLSKAFQACGYKPQGSVEKMKDVVDSVISNWYSEDFSRNVSCRFIKILNRPASQQSYCMDLLESVRGLVKKKHKQQQIQNFEPFLKKPPFRASAALVMVPSLRNVSQDLLLRIDKVQTESHLRLIKQSGPPRIQDLVAHDLGLFLQHVLTSHEITLQPATTIIRENLILYQTTFFNLKNLRFMGSSGKSSDTTSKIHEADIWILKKAEYEQGGWHIVHKRSGAYLTADNQDVTTSKDLLPVFQKNRQIWEIVKIRDGWGVRCFYDRDLYLKPDNQSLASFFVFCGAQTMTGKLTLPQGDHLWLMDVEPQ